MAGAIRKYSPEDTKNRIMRWCDRRERTHWEAREKLRDWGVPHTETESLIGELISLSFINEHRYACAFANDKSRFYSWGIRKIINALKSKGVSEKNIQAAIRQLDAAAYDQTLNLLLQKKLASMKDPLPVSRKHKAARFLIGKGYEPEIVWKKISEVFPD